MLMPCPTGRKHNHYGKGENLESDFSIFNTPCGLRLQLMFPLHKTRKKIVLLTKEINFSRSDLIPRCIYFSCNIHR